MTTTTSRRGVESARSSSSATGSLAAAVLGAVLVVLIVGGGVVLTQPTWRGLIVVPVLAAVSVPVIRWAAPDLLALRSLLWAGLAYKGIAVFLRFLMVTEWYEGGDSGRYAEFATQVASQVRNLDFGWSPAGKVPGTGFIEIVAGVVYAFAGADLFTGFLVFGFLAWLGTICMYKALVVAWPQADHRRYALLVFFWPTLTFWPSTIGKDAWMVLTLGVAALGGARMLASGRRGYLLFALGVTGATMVRPHVAVVFVGAMVVAFVIGAIARGDGHRAGRIGRTIAAVAVVVAAALVAPVVSDYFGVDLGSDGLEEVLSETNRRTSQGGSEFASVAVNDPTDFPWAAITVVARPFPFEANSIQTLISAAEGMALLALIVASHRRLTWSLRGALRSPWPMLAVAYTLSFIYVFSAIANFGILARQRVQLLPFLLILVAGRRSHPEKTETVRTSRPYRPRSLGLAPPRPVALGRAVRQAGVARAGE